MNHPAPRKPNYAARDRRRQVTRERILSRSSDLFYRKGIAAVSMEEASAHADVTKPTLYAHFPTKAALVAQALSSVDQKHFDWFVRQLQRHVNAGETPVLAVFGVLDGWFRSPVFRGCAYINASIEIGTGNPPAQLAVLRHKERTREWLRHLAEQSGVDHLHCGSLAAHLMLLMEGAIVTAVVEGDGGSALRAREAAAVLLEAARAAGDAAPQAPS